MAGSVTHTYFAKDLYNELDNDTKDIIKDSINSFETFAQGPDIFFFNKTMSKKYTNLFHTTHTQTYFISLIDYIRKHHLENDSEIMAYLYGQIAHYALDSTIHPYVIYKGGYFYKNDIKTLKYNGGHSDVESYIDAYMINKRENIDPNKLDVGKFCFQYKPLSDELINLINEVYYSSHKVKNMGKKYKSCLKKMKRQFHRYRYDKNGRKKKFYIFIDKKLPKKTMKFAPVSYVYTLNKNHYYLNLDKRKWCHPMDKNETYKDSFEDLYNKAIKKAIKLINASNAVLFYNKTTNYLKTYFENLSYLSGKPCNDKRKFKYFEF